MFRWRCDQEREVKGRRREIEKESGRRRRKLATTISRWRATRTWEACGFDGLGNYRGEQQRGVGQRLFHSRTAAAWSSYSDRFKGFSSGSYFPRRWWQMSTCWRPERRWSSSRIFWRGQRWVMKIDRGRESICVIGAHDLSRQWSLDAGSKKDQRGKGVGAIRWNFV